MSNILLLDSDNFSRMLYQPEQQPGQCVIVYFSASWCVPCKNMQPIFQQVANHIDDKKIVFGVVDIAQSPTLAPKYGIKTVPTIAIFQDTRLVHTIAGEVTLNNVLMVLKQVLDS
ncbi:thioredoxin family protein [Providencia rettgeri]|nr:thioredoxin family protein [Providencia rettgeri]HEC8346935.1 thioredoxin family protein [Providencia rettgeri]